MKTLVTITASGPQADEVLAASPELAEKFSAGIFRAATLDGAGKDFAECLEAFRELAFEWVLEVQYSSKELSNFDFLEVKPKKLLKLGDSEANLNEYLIASSAPLEVWPSSPIKLPRGLILGRSLPKGDCIECLDFAAEFVAGDAATEVLRSLPQDLGLELIPVFWSKERAREESVTHLHTTQIAPQVCLSDEVWSEQHQGLHRWRRLGCLVYESIRDLPEICRTAEPWAGWHEPQWIVDQRVREIVEGNKIKGWRYLPVLEEGSPAYLAHLEQVTAVRRALAWNPKATMR